jgi:hypothetical protein
VKNAFFWDGTPCGFYKNRCFVGTYRLHHQDEKNQGARNNVSSNHHLVPSSMILATLMMEPIISSETSVLKRATRRSGIFENVEDPTIAYL